MKIKKESVPQKALQCITEKRLDRTTDIPTGKSIQHVHSSAALLDGETAKDTQSSMDSSSPILVKSQASSESTDNPESWQQTGILRQALLSINSTGQIEKVDANEENLHKMTSSLVQTGEMKFCDISKDGTGGAITDSERMESHGPFAAGTVFSSSVALPFVSLPFATVTQAPVTANSGVSAQSTVSHTAEVHSCDITSSLESLPNVLPTTSSSTTTGTKEINLSVEYVSENVSSSSVSGPTNYFGPTPHLCQTIASPSSKDDSVTVVYSSFPKLESHIAHAIHNVEKTVPLPSISEVKSSLTNHIGILTPMENKSSETCLQSKVPVPLTVISSIESDAGRENLSFGGIADSEVNSMTAIKIDDNADGSGFTNATMSLASDHVKFSSDSVSSSSSSSSSDISSNIVIPVSSDVILTKIDGQNSSAQDISHIITIPLPVGTLYNSPLAIPMPLPICNGIASLSTTQATSTILPSLSCSISGIPSQPCSSWPNSSVALSVTSSSQLGTSVTTSLPVSIMSVSSSLPSVVGNNMIHFTSSSVVSTPQNSSNTVNTVAQDPMCYTAEILSQLSKAGALPAMSSSQVSSVLSALASDPHDLETDSVQHSEILANQILQGDKVSTLTQTDTLGMNIMPHDEKIIHLLGGQHLLEHQVNGSQIMMSASIQNHLPDIPRESETSCALGSAELGTSELVETKQTFPRIVAMVLNTPAIGSEKLTVPSVIADPVFRNNMDKVPEESLNDPPCETASDSIHEFLVLPNNPKPKRRHSKRTNCLREMLLGTSESLEKDATKKPRVRQKKKSDCVSVKDLNSRKCVTPLENVSSSEAVRSSDLRLMKEGDCYKCKFCPFLSLEGTTMESHIKEKHISEMSGECVVRQQLKCPGCPNVFFSTSSLEVHLKQDHQVNAPELKAITSSAIKVVERKKRGAKKKMEKQMNVCNSNVHVQNGNSVENVQTEIALLKAGRIQQEVQSINVESIQLQAQPQSQQQVQQPVVEQTEVQRICVENIQSKVQGADIVSDIETEMQDIGISVQSMVHISDTLMNSNDISILNANTNTNGSGILLSEHKIRVRNLNGYSNVDASDDIMNISHVEEPVRPVLRCRKKIPEVGTVLNTDSHVNNKAGAGEPKRKRGRPKGSKSSTGPKIGSDGRPVKKQSTGHKCNVDCCAVTMRSPQNIEYHRACHSGTEFKCPECGYTHSHWNGMSAHLWRLHVVDMELYTCDQCNYKTHSYAKLINLHKWIHGSERPCLCDSCGKGFKNRKQLRNHKATHQQKEVQVDECEICGRAFSNKRMLRMHMDNVHNKLRPHLCNYCGYSAASVSSLKMHMRKHTGEKPFRCNLCDYCTADHNSLRRHKMQHTGDKPYKCPHCTYACIQSSTYKAHLKTKHPGMDDGLMFSCSLCSFRSVKEENYIAHLPVHKMVAPSKNQKSSNKQPTEGSDKNTKSKKAGRDGNKAAKTQSRVDVAKESQAETDHTSQLPSFSSSEQEDERFDMEGHSESVIHLVEHLGNGNTGRYSIVKLGSMESATEVQMALETDFEPEEITGDIPEAELITGDIEEPQEFKVCEMDLKMNSCHDEEDSSPL